MIARDLMDSQAVTLNENATLEEVFELIRRYKTADYPVVDTSMDYRGMFFETRLLEKIYGEADKKKEASLEVAFLSGIKKDLRGIRVRDLMDSKVRTFASHEAIERIGAVMLFEKVAKVAVTDQGKVIGVVSLSRILSSLTEQLVPQTENKKNAPSDDFPADDPRNKRFFKRTPVAVPVAYRLFSEAGKGFSEGKIAQTGNVSAGGLSIFTREPLPVGQSLNVALDIYQNDHPIRMVCRIVRCLPSKESGVFEVGLMFVAIGIEERRRLDDHFGKMPQ